MHLIRMTIQSLEQEEMEIVFVDRGDEGATVKTNSNVQGGKTSNKAATQGLLGGLDYAIAEGVELQRPSSCSS